MNHRGIRVSCISPTARPRSRPMFHRWPAWRVWFTCPAPTAKALIAISFTPCGKTVEPERAWLINGGENPKLVYSVRSKKNMKQISIFFVFRIRGVLFLEDV